MAFITNALSINKLHKPSKQNSFSMNHKPSSISRFRLRASNFGKQVARTTKRIASRFITMTHKPFKTQKHKKLIDEMNEQLKICDNIINNKYKIQSLCKCDEKNMLPYSQFDKMFRYAITHWILYRKIDKFSDLINYINRFNDLVECKNTLTNITDNVTHIKTALNETLNNVQPETTTNTTYVESKKYYTLPTQNIKSFIQMLNEIILMEKMSHSMPISNNMVQIYNRVYVPQNQTNAQSSLAKLINKTSKLYEEVYKAQFNQQKKNQHKHNQQTLSTQQSPVNSIRQNEIFNNSHHIPLSTTLPVNGKNNAKPVLSSNTGTLSAAPSPVNSISNNYIQPNTTLSPPVNGKTNTQHVSVSNAQTSGATLSPVNIKSHNNAVSKLSLGNSQNSRRNIKTFDARLPPVISNSENSNSSNNNATKPASSSIARIPSATSPLVKPNNAQQTSLVNPNNYKLSGKNAALVFGSGPNTKSVNKGKKEPSQHQKYRKKRMQKTTQKRKYGKSF